MSKVSDFQKSILDKMRFGYKLSSTYTTETAPYRHENGMAGAWIETHSVSLYVSYRTIAALLNRGLIEEARRYMSSSHMQGENTWESYSITYRLTEKGMEVK